MYSFSISNQGKKLLGPAIILLLALIAFYFDQAISSLEFNRAAITGGEWWRVITGHFYHTNTNHFLLNSAAIVLLAMLHKQFYNIKIYVSLFLLCGVFVSLCLLSFSELNYYVGLSGVLHGVFIYGALCDIRHKDKTGYLLMIGAIAKIVHEQAFGASEQVSQLIQANVAVDAHLYGAISGLIFFICHTFLRMYVSPKITE